MNTILFIDHEPTVRNVLRRELAGHYQMLEARSPVEALDLFRNHSGIDLLVCNADMGLVSGMELASLLRAWNSKLCTILITERPCECWTERQNAELREVPTDAVLILEQPFSTRDLRAAIAKLAPEEVGATTAGMS